MCLASYSLKKIKRFGLKSVTFSCLLLTGGRIDVIYTDLEKAFDKIPHRRLISKLYSYGLNENIILWIEAFLADRKQRVIINGVTSHWSDVLSGVPKGSILGPILFIIYISTT